MSNQLTLYLSWHLNKKCPPFISGFLSNSKMRWLLRLKIMLIPVHVSSYCKYTVFRQYDWMFKHKASEKWTVLTLIGKWVSKNSHFSTNAFNSGLPYMALENNFSTNCLKKSPHCFIDEQYINLRSPMLFVTKEPPMLGCLILTPMPYHWDWLGGPAC